MKPHSPIQMLRHVPVKYPHQQFILSIELFISLFLEMYEKLTKLETVFKMAD